MLGLGRLDDAEAQELEAIRRRSDIPLAYLILGNVHIARHQYSQLIEDLDHFLELQPTGPASDSARHTRELALKQVAGASDKEMAATRRDP